MFKIPLETEVAKYMREKKGWPVEFCKYYAEKFYSHYQSNGWKVSGRAAMKDWKAAFNSQWQSIRYDEDRKELERIMKQEPPKPKEGQKQSPLERLDYLMLLYVKQPEAIKIDTFCKIHDWLKERNMLKITDDQEQIVKDACDDECRAKAMRVKFQFMNMYGEYKTFVSLGRISQRG